MNIIELRASNFARLTAVTIRPDGSLVQITGANSNGKTSVLNAIWAALKGRAAAGVVPVHKGAEQARIDLDLGTMVITRTFKQAKGGYDFTSDLKVTMADGSRVATKPQAMIDALLGDLSFNPLEFAKLPAKDQFERVKALVPDFDFEANAKLRADCFAKRTVSNRQAQEATACAASIRLPPGPRPTVSDTGALAKELHAASVQNSARDMEAANREIEQRDIQRILDEAELLRARATRLENQATERQAALEARPPLQPLIATDKIAAEIASADGLRKIAEAHDERERYLHQALTAEAAAHKLTEEIDECDMLMRRAVAAAKMPVGGLSFGDDEVLLNGLPFSQAGTAEKIVTSMAIGMALNPKLRVMLIDEGSELDGKGLALVAGIAKDRDYQVWMARVDESGKTGFVIEDGKVKS